MPYRARATASGVVASLLGAVSQPQLERLAGFALEWLSGRDGRLRRAACQVRFHRLQLWSCGVSCGDVGD